jgi:probable regulatory domain-containing protein
MSEVPLKPLGKEEIRKLELALILTTLTRPDVIEKIRSAEDKLTWLDSLVIAAAALARDKAGYPVSVIAEELGRSEITIRNHLAGKTEAGKLVLESYEILRSAGGTLSIPIATSSEIESLRKRIAELESIIKEKDKTIKILNEKLAKVKHYLSETLKELS